MLKKDLLSNVDEFEVIRFKRPTNMQQSRDDRPDIPFYEIIAIDKRHGPTFNIDTDRWEVHVAYYGYDLVYGAAVEEVLQSRDQRVYDECICLCLSTSELQESALDRGTLTMAVHTTAVHKESSRGPSWTT